MGRRKYFCEYCEKEFYDDPVNRRRHLTSFSHLRNKGLWYEAVESANNKPIETDNREICKLYLTQGLCAYGDSCRFRHPADVVLPSGLPAESVAAAAAAVGGSLDAARRSRHLPPSLQPPPEGGWKLPLPTLDWG
eukprot:TRINITY_DN29389_c0_g1_i1.p1 TRINITY_DN29389_c0_g1~~TRINITY_DN29389_c0_g1_i1.p1  ORF type:complete len:135 (+),score=19.72 TRINITY_DN29389_c0_g1_i1:579-983(+)